MLDLLANMRLRKLTLFENFNRQYTAAYSLTAGSSMDRPFPAGNSQSLCRVSFGLESLSAAFLVDASEFFNLDSSMPAHDWPNLTTL